MTTLPGRPASVDRLPEAPTDIRLSIANSSAHNDGERIRSHRFHHSERSPLVNRFLSLSALSLIAVTFAGCFGEHTADTPSPSPEEAPPVPFDQRLLEIAQTYETYRFLEQERMKPAGFVCDFAPSRFIAGVHPLQNRMQFSGSPDSSAH